MLNHEQRNLVPQLRIAVNSRCQKACFYCRPSGEGSVQFPDYELSSEEIVLLVRHLARHGVSDVKLTGGDPVLRSDIVELVSEIKNIPGITSVHIVTRHSRAGQLASELKEAGLDCLNYSLDTLDPQKFKLITGVEGHKELVESVRNSVPVSKSVKINTVIMAGINSDEWHELIRFSEDAGVETLKFLDLILNMNMEGNNSFSYRLRTIAPNRTFDDLYFPLDEIADYLSTVAVSQDISRQPGGLGHPMMRYTLASGLKVELKDARRGAWYSNVCYGCVLYPCHDAIMAMRLTTEGKLQRCLAREDNLLDVLTPLRNGDINLLDRLITESLLTYKLAEFDPHPQIKAIEFHPLEELHR